MASQTTVKEPKPLSPAGAGPSAFDRLCTDGRSGPPPRLLVRLWRAVVRPLLSLLLRLVMKDSVTTSQSMLLMRTFFRDYGMPHANRDSIAPLFRDGMAAIGPEAAMFRARSRFGWYRGHLMTVPIVGCPGIGHFVDVRTAWLDEAVEEALKGPGAAEQVVIIAAGYDTRPYRLHRPGVSFFEIDLPESTAAKKRLVETTLPDAASYPRPVYIAADLSKVSLESALEGSGFDRSKRSVFVAEGLLYYLPPAAVRQLFESVASLSAPRSRFCFDWLRLSVMQGAEFNPGYETLATAVANRGEPFLSAIDDATPGALDAIASEFGFARRFSSGSEAMARRYYKGAVLWRDFPATVTTCFGYALLERAGGEGGGGGGAAGGGGGVKAE